MTLTLLAALLLSSSPTPHFVLHEWGTFTSVAGHDGVELDWAPLSGESDLPTFVHTEANPGTRFTGAPSRGKGERGTLRMETPVIYFYADQELELELSVGFVGGRLTEWYPQARSLSASDSFSLLDWGKLRILPNALGVELPVERAPSHYYPAREVDAALVRSCGEAQTEVERFLFYRGVGRAPLPLNATLSSKGVHVAIREDATDRRTVILFERRGDRAGFTVGRAGSTLPRPALTGALSGVHAALRELLLAEKLYPKESDAMLATWKDSWFEEGLRAFYVLPTDVTERLLPLTVSPAPSERVRVMVGRVELFTPEALSEVSSLPAPALEKKYGRFLPVMRELSER